MERREYLRSEIERAARAVSAWYRENAPLGWGDEAKRYAMACETLLVEALAAVDGEWTDRTERVVKARLDGVYAYISQPVPKWTDPVRDTAKGVGDVAKGVGDVAKASATWGLGGASLGLVVLGGLWLWAQVK